MHQPYPSRGCSWDQKEATGSDQVSEAGVKWRRRMQRRTRRKRQCPRVLAKKNEQKMTEKNEVMLDVRRKGVVYVLEHPHAQVLYA